MGKLSNEALKKMLTCIKKSPKVIVPPLPGFDSGVHLIDAEKCMVVSTDPCIGVPQKWFGWLLIHYAASDVALFGAKPEFCSINLLGPMGTSNATFYDVMRHACVAADELEMAVVTGHTGTYEGLSTLLGTCTAYGVIDKNKLITPGSAKLGDYILCIKPIGFETVVNFALTQPTLAKKLFGAKQTVELEKLVSLQTCVKEALLLAGIEGTHAMHDATEGGFVAALNEMAVASKVGFRVEFEKLPIPKEAMILKKHFCLTDEELLSMSSTGTIVAAVAAEARNKVETVLQRHDIKASVVGVFTKTQKHILIKDGKHTVFSEKADDPYERIMSV
jgi:hydrogenase maturation factor